MKEQKYWRNMLTTSHNIPWWYLHHITHYKNNILLSLVMFVDVENQHFVQVFIQVCVFITFATEVSKECSISKIDSGHSHMFEEAWLLVLVGHPHHSPPLTFHSNPSPYELLYSMPNPPTQPRYTLHQHLPPIATICIYIFVFPLLYFFTSNIHWWNGTCQFICCSFHSHFLTFRFVSKSWASSTCFVWFGDSSLSTLESSI